MAKTKEDKYIRTRKEIYDPLIAEFALAAYDCGRRKVSPDEDERYLKARANLQQSVGNLINDRDAKSAGMWEAAHRAAALEEELELLKNKSKKKAYKAKP